MAIKIIEEHNIAPPKLPRKKYIPLKFVGGVRDTQNVQVKDHYRINIYFTILDIIIREMELRFKENQLYILNGLKEIIINEKPDDKVFKLICDTYDMDKLQITVELNCFNRMFLAKHPDITGNSNIFNKKNRVYE